MNEVIIIFHLQNELLFLVKQYLNNHTKAVNGAAIFNISYITMACKVVPFHPKN